MDSNESDDTYVSTLRSVRPTICYGCGQELHTYNLLICAECLDDQCGNFAKMADKIDQKNKK